MRITREETFGPVIAVTTFESDDEAIDRANSTQYGLAAYIYTHDLSKAIRIAERLDVGMVGVNDTRIAAVESSVWRGKTEWHWVAKAVVKD